MKTDQLIDMLARGVEPTERPRWARRLALSLALGLAAALALLITALKVRPDIGVAPMPVMMTFSSRVERRA